jgi:hypothetical protein
MRKQTRLQHAYRSLSDSRKLIDEIYYSTCYLIDQHNGSRQDTLMCSQRKVVPLNLGCVTAKKVDCAFPSI